MRTDIHIAFIGLDGWGSYDLEKSFAHMPNVSSYSKEGIFTDNKIAVTPTISAPNWASMFMGANPDVHGFIQNTKTPSISYPFAVKNNIFPTISQLIKNECPTTPIGLLCNWRGLLYLVDTKSIDYVYNVPRIVPYSQKILTYKTSKYVKTSKPLLCTIVYDEMDHIGHRYGFFSYKYYSKLEYLDECIKRIVEAYKEAGIYDDTVFILTSDHGGNGITHEFDSLQEIKTPFVMWGKGVNKTGYHSDKMDQKDVAAIMATILDVKKPYMWTGDNHIDFFNI